MSEIKLSIDENKSEVLDKKLNESLPSHKGEIYVIPLNGFEKWIVLWSLNDKYSNMEKINLYFLKPITIKSLNELPYEKRPSWLQYLWAKTDLFHPLSLSYYLTEELEHPKILSGHSAITGIDPSKNQEHINEIIKFEHDIRIQTLKNEDSKIRDENGEFNVITGNYFDVVPPYLFLFLDESFEANNKALIRNQPSYKVIFEIDDEKFGKFLVWNKDYIFIEEKPSVEEPVEFLNLFLFYLRLFNKHFNVLGLTRCHNTVVKFKDRGIRKLRVLENYGVVITTLNI